jgi:hypothetical protein
MYLMHSKVLKHLLKKNLDIRYVLLGLSEESKAYKLYKQGQKDSDKKICHL